VLTESHRGRPRGRISPSTWHLEGRACGEPRARRSLPPPARCCGWNPTRSCWLQGLHPCFRGTISGARLIAEGGWRPIYSSTAKGFTRSPFSPKPSTPEGMRAVTHASPRALAAALEAGFELVEIHGAHATSSISSSRRWSTPVPTSTAAALRTAPAFCARSSQPFASLARGLPLWLRIPPRTDEGGWTSRIPSRSPRR